MTKNIRKAAYSFIVLLGIVSLLSDMAYEGARSIIGPYLGLLGATAATIGFVSGLGEFVGYAFRLITGFISDKTKRYWTMTIIGYAMNIVAIPLLAIVPADGWMYACGLVLLERFGKAIRTPSKSTLVSFAASEVGAGKGFAIQEALDQLGAFISPVILFFMPPRWESMLYPLFFSGGFMIKGDCFRWSSRQLSPHFLHRLYFLQAIRRLLYLVWSFGNRHGRAGIHYAVDRYKPCRPKSPGDRLRHLQYRFRPVLVYR